MGQGESVEVSALISPSQIFVIIQMKLQNVSQGSVEFRFFKSQHRKNSMRGKVIGKK